MAENCELNNNNEVGCKEYGGVTSGMFIKSTPFSYTESEMNDLDFIKSELVATENRLYILKDVDDYESIQNRTSQNAQTASGRQLFYGPLPWSFALKVRKPRAYDIRSSFLDGTSTQKVYGIPFSTKGVINPNLIDGEMYAKAYDMTKELLESEDYTGAEKMLKYSFSEYTPELNVKYYESIKPTTYDPNSLIGVNDVEITIVSASATTIVCTINLAGESGNNIAVLETANFQKLDGSGIVEAVTSAYNAATGQYTLTGTGLTTGTLQVIPVATDDVYYESALTAVTVTP